MRRWLFRIGVGVLGVLGLAALALWWLLRGSLPQLDGEVALPGLAAPVSISRDALGVVTIAADSEPDAMRALGWVHAQERYFEMDLLRRSSAGELAALVGAAALPADRRQRMHRMRARVEANLAERVGAQSPQLSAYVEGVNAGLAALRVRPWPYLLLRQRPVEWTAADSLLAGYAMYFDLQDSNNRNELALWRIRPHLPPALYALITHQGSRWEAPLQGAPRGDARLPGADELDLRALLSALPDTPDTAGVSVVAGDELPGSNNFAVSGALTADGRAILANDMHLTLRAPNIWFRARLTWPDASAPGGRVEVQGMTLPGLPAVIVGSNGQVAWGFTNSYLDAADWKLETPCADGATADCAPLHTHVERIAVAGGQDETLEVRESAWGPLMHTLDDGRALSLRWLGHLPDALNLGLAEFVHARDLAHALELADATAIPTQNLLLADRNGDIAWRLLGPIPQRAPGCAHGAEVITPEMDCPPWPLSTAASPLIASPDHARLWTANARVVDGQALQRIGDGGYALGARAGQIRDDLSAKAQFAEADLLAIQLDDRTTVLDDWWELLNTQADAAATPAMAELLAAIPAWEGRAGIDAVGYRIVRAWRLAVLARLQDGLTAPARAALTKGTAMPRLRHFEAVAWPLVTERPLHLLPPNYPDWQALFEAAAVEVRDDLQHSGPLAARTWGEANTAAICHPLTAALPQFTRRWLCMPADPLPGDTMMARVQGPGFGASERMVVAPGHEAEGILHMPGGQSGHPLSPFWGAGHADWAQGRATPFLPGAETRRLTVRPQ